MSSAAIPIRSFETGTSGREKRRAFWSLLELAPAGRSPVTVGLILIDGESDFACIRMREASETEHLEEDEAEILDFLAEDLAMKARESGGKALLDSLEDSLSNFLRIENREEISISGTLDSEADRLYFSHVDSEIRPFVKHLPLYSLRAAATKFGEQMEVEELDWLRVPGARRLTPDMFVAQVVGRSMEPLIPDGSFCIFRSAVTGSRQGKRLLIEQFGDLDNSSRYTVKRYTSKKIHDETTGEWMHDEILLEPLNREFEAFHLGPDQFRVVAEFVEVLSS